MDMLRSSRALPQPLLAQTILAATSAVVMSALSLWLVFWLFFVRPDLNVLRDLGRSAAWFGADDGAVLPGERRQDLRRQGDEEAGKSLQGRRVDPPVS